MRHYCTYFDRHYLLRGLTLYRSLQQHTRPFTLWVLCFDDDSYQTLTKLSQPDLIPIALADFERGDDALLAAKATRSKVEYFFTCSPSWPLYLLNRHPEIEILTYLDADLFFYSSLEPIFDEMTGNSILIVGHRFPEHLRRLELFGIYNVGLLSFRNDTRARECLHWWRERCLEWCGILPEEGRFADQKYLDDWPERFAGTHVLQHKGAGLAPWNWMNYRIKRQGTGVEVDGEPLIFYHYHDLKFFSIFLNRWLYDPIVKGREYGEMPTAVKRLLYPPYVQALAEAEKWLDDEGCDLKIERIQIGAYGWRIFLSKVRRRQLMFSIVSR